MQKGWKKSLLRNILYLISPLYEHFKTEFKQIQEATVWGYNFCFWLFLVIGHVTIILTCYWMNPDKQNHHYWFSWPFGHTRSHFLLEVYVEDPDMDSEGSASLCIHCIHQLYFFWTFDYSFTWNTQISFFGHLEPDNSNLEVCKDHINSTQQ